MKWVLGMVLVALVLAGCSTSSSNVAGASSSPEQVHQAWVAAMEHNDRAAALALAAAMEYQSAFVDGELRRMQDTLRAAKDGPLQSVDVRAPMDEGAGKLGVSVWRFAKRPVCYGTSLVERDGGWKVVSWGIVVAACTGVK